MHNINNNMNTTKDFHKKDNGVVININTKDYMRARNRNYNRREQSKIIGSDGKVASLEREVTELKLLIKELLENK